MNLKYRIKRIAMRLMFPHHDPDMVFLFMNEAIAFFKSTNMYNASVNTDDDIEKMQYTILRENHVIEKGMSMRNPRKGFGQKKVTNLLERLGKYYSLYGLIDKGFLKYPLSTIKGYIQYTEENGTQIPKIKKQYEQLASLFSPSDICTHAGVVEVTKDSIQRICNSDFKSLLMSRHSIRYFSSDAVDKNTIEQALRLAQCTPSACNRQGWKTHVFLGDKSVSLIKWQGGARGFEEEMRHSILVTANLKAFLSYEVHQAYIDGGLYAMNLINAIHSLGLGCIPLSCGFDHKKLKELNMFEIPENEVPIVIVCFGHLLEKFKVAVSNRKDISLTNTYHS